MTSSSPSRAWVAGGILLIASTVIPMVSQAVVLPGLGVFDSVLFAAALGLFALGRPSVTDRRALGTTALLALGVWTVVVEIFFLVAGPEVAAGMGTTVGYVDEAVRAALAIVGVVAISRAGAVRRPWHLAPLWTLVAFVVPQLVLAVLAASPATVDTAISVAPLGSVVYIAAPLFLGVLAIVLGVTPPRRGESAEPVFSGRADDPA